MELLLRVVQFMIILLIAQELFSSFKSKKGNLGMMGVKLDLEKAYDLLNWGLYSVCFKSFWIQ